MWRWNWRAPVWVEHQVQKNVVCTSVLNWNSTDSDKTQLKWWCSLSVELWHRFSSHLWALLHRSCSQLKVALEGGSPSSASSLGSILLNSPPHQLTPFLHSSAEEPHTNSAAKRSSSIHRNYSPASVWRNSYLVLTLGLDTTTGISSSLPDREVPSSADQQQKAKRPSNSIYVSTAHECAAKLSIVIESKAKLKAPK